MQFDEIFTATLEKEISLGARKYSFSHSGVLKPEKISASNNQEQTQEIFGFKWKKEDTFDSQASLSRMKDWLIDRYKLPEYWLEKISTLNPIVLDAGCGAGMSGFEYWNSVMNKICYFGVDISEAVDVACKRYRDNGYKNGVFLQESISDLPFLKPTFDIIFSEGVLHHTDNTEKTFGHLCQILKKDGLFMFYVYRKKAPIREYTDDYIREKLQTLSPENAWKELESLTELGIELGKLNIDINISRDIPLLCIPAGKINLQRFFYWNICKAFYDPNLSFEEMQHINFDWYAPKNAHRHTIEEIRQWCRDNELDLLYEKEELSGITCVAKKK